ncbi:hypothetical protein PIB30_073884 [Stylosanthes scabra]|uniref:Secreted protein n=1 Tax=Stylosanthes scabra TaxID=79078 RepID=A0ABU6YM38_9FABA|nr:hypothetical protein [Stylosanthes scabra]
MFTGVCLACSSLGLWCEEESKDGGCWFAWWCHNRESPEPPLRPQEFTVVSSHRRCSLSSPEFIRLPKTKPYPSLDLSSVGSPTFRGVGAVRKAWRMAWVEWVSVTAELACRYCLKS